MKLNTLLIDFFLVGAARCGTTSLYNHLNHNDEVFLPDVKEPNFFSELDSPNAEDFIDPEKGVKYHAKIIKDPEIYQSLYIDAGRNQIKGDSSPSYLWDKNVAQKLYQHNPKAKIIVSLRHPVDRAYSHYIMNYYTGVDHSKTFEKALERPKNDMWGSCNYYLEMGMYYEQLKAYFDIFPKEQIKILIYEDWTTNREQALSDLFKFLGVSNVHSNRNRPVEQNKIEPVKGLALLNFLRQNKIKLFVKRLISQEKIDWLKSRLFSGSKPIQKIDPVLREQLFERYKNDIQKLSRLSGIDFQKFWTN